MNRAFSAPADRPIRFPTHERARVNGSLTNAFKVAATSFPHRRERTLWHQETNKKTEEATMFVAIRVMILIASAYAGSAVAEMQFAPLPSLASSSAP